MLHKKTMHGGSDYIIWETYIDMKNFIMTLLIFIVNSEIYECN